MELLKAIATTNATNTPHHINSFEDFQLLPGSLPAMLPGDLPGTEPGEEQLAALNRTVREKLGEEYELKAYYGEEVLTLAESTLDALARCYMTVFNESWGEDWTESSAKSEIKDSLQCDPDRIPLLSLLYKEADIIGFCWVLLLDKSALSKERDMPWELSDAEKIGGLAISTYWMDEIVKKDRIMFIKELGALKEHRQKVTPFLLIPLFERAVKMGYDVAFLWTNVYSKAFKWGLGVGFSPIHFFITNNLLLMYGGVKGSLVILKTVVEASFSKQSQSYMIKNINKYLLKGEARN
ncbi:MAG: hypothetical protein V4751_13580 [Pseudomonadota bacterium]